MSTCAPLIFSPQFPLFYWISLREKNGNGERRQTSSLIYLSSLTMLVQRMSGEREECNGAIYSNRCLLKRKKSISPSPSPLYTHPSSLLKTREKCNCPPSVRCVPPLFLTPVVIILSPIYASILSVCLYHCLDAFSSGCIIHFSSSHCTPVVNWVEARGERGKLGEEEKGIKRQWEGAMLRATHLKLALFETWPTRVYSLCLPRVLIRDQNRSTAVQ